MARPFRIHTGFRVVVDAIILALSQAPRSGSAEKYRVVQTIDDDQPRIAAQAVTARAGLKPTKRPIGSAVSTITRVSSPPCLR